MSFCYPSPLCPGDRVALVAPSGPCEPNLFFQMLGWIQGRYQVQVQPGILARKGYLAGDDQRRREELSSAFCDPGIKAVIAVRGGYGATRIVDALPWEELKKHPKWLVGMSDCTALHLEVNRRSITSIHAGGTMHLCQSPYASVHRADLMRLLEHPDASYQWPALSILHPGGAQGPLMGGNLALLEATAAAGRLAFPSGVILALEDVAEAPYRIDRMLTALRLGGYLKKVGGIVFGKFTRSKPGRYGVSTEEVLIECTRDLAIPVYADAPFGHGTRNRAFILGSWVTLRKGTVTFEQKKGE
ncbi:S66 peptidase family protein [Pajaroellobacter abortibovis]|uniref:LD-carboxypeptidase n=1 Tax=Pajaroellobacter abortibovis TaxID=1882918 RepID=A0A1L6MW89_9BACT|nr:LD-carboxypeptidase [Pajaroellobacter abortibovis]APR99786.1 hypothetical protein BCY86_03175 [Pajaroellobacter abortibovis]